MLIRKMEHKIHIQGLLKYFGVNKNKIHFFKEIIVLSEFLKEKQKSPIQAPCS